MQPSEKLHAFLHFLGALQVQESGIFYIAGQLPSLLRISCQKGTVKACSCRALQSNKLPLSVNEFFSADARMSVYELLLSNLKVVQNRHDTQVKMTF